VSAPGAGTVYVIAVSGDKYVGQVRRDYVEVGMTNVSTFQTIEIDPISSRLMYTAFTEDGRIVDELRIQKPMSARSDRLVRGPERPKRHD
jgi:hypothetical protein